MLIDSIAQQVEQSVEARCAVGSNPTACAKHGEHGVAVSTTGCDLVSMGSNPIVRPSVSTVICSCKGNLILLSDRSAAARRRRGWRVASSPSSRNLYGNYLAGSRTPSQVVPFFFFPQSRLIGIHLFQSSV